MADSMDHLPKEFKYSRVRTPTIIQMEAVECGAASLGIILGYYGCYVPLDELRVVCAVSRDGSNALNVIKAARKYGLIAKGWRKEIHEFHTLPLPFIAHWGFNHFLVIEGFGENEVFINDPATGPRKISYQDLDFEFTGIALSFEVGPDFQKRAAPPVFFKAVTKRITSVKSGIIFSILAGICLIIPQLALVGFSQVFIDRFLIGNNLEWGTGFLFGLFGITLLICLLVYVKQEVLSRINTKLSILFSTSFYWHIISLPIQFYAQRFSGEIANRMNLNDGVAQAITKTLAENIIQAILALAYGLAMFYYDAVVASIGVILVFLNVMLLRKIFRDREDAYIYFQQATGKSVGFSIGGLQYMETIKATSSEYKFFSRWAGYYTKALNSLQSITRKDIVTGVVPPFFEAFAAMIILISGAWRIMDGHMTIGMLLALQILMRNFTTPILSLVGLTQRIQLVKVDTARLDDVMEHPIDPLLHQDPSSLMLSPSSKLEGYMEIKDLTFGFNPLGAPLVQDIHFKLTPGKSIALVGPSGSGKSTLARLVGGFYKPWKGEILFDGLPREKIPRELITHSLAIVEQETTIFSASVKDNITLMETFPNQQNLFRATRDACLHEDIMARKGGYELLLEKDGTNLSGGQRQRLEIARALYRNPSLLILDEATSALDSTTELEVIKNIRRRGCACLMVAHRLSTIRNCDEIIVLSHGVIMERGSHAELLENPGIYRNLIEVEKLNRSEEE